MHLKIARHLWGVDLPWDVAIAKYAAQGYELMEWLVPPEAPDQRRVRELLAEHRMGFIAIAATGGKSVDEHLASFRRELDRAIQFNARQLTIHSGSDAFSADQANAFYREVVAIERDAPIPVAHETHRGRTFFSPWSTRPLLERFEPLKLCCDFSHWVVVAERFDWDDPDGSILALCAQRALHIHGRVGYEEGPQVPDPAAPEYARAVERHLTWWESIWSAQRTRGQPDTTITPEFGPPTYLHTLPHSNTPVADLPTVVDWMAAKIRERFARWAA